MADIAPERHNAVLKKIELASGKRYQRRSTPVQIGRYKVRVRQLQKLRRECKANKPVRATYYGGYGDDTGVGYRGDDLGIQNGKPTTPANWNTFAELSTNPFGKLDFAALGGLPYKAERWIHYRRRSEKGVKRDIGAGGSRYPKIDLFSPLARKLKFSDGLVYVTKRPCRGVFK